MPTQRGLSSFVAAGIALTLLAACGSGDDAGDSGDSGDDPASPFDSPLADLMGWQNESPEESRRKQLEVEELVAQCMREEGWEYSPVDYASQFPDQDEDAELWQDPEAYGKKYGYGVVYNYEQWEEPSLVNGGEAPVDDGFEDPNADYVNELSESEQEAYYASLYGKPEEEPMSDDGTPVTISFAGQGCYGQASSDVWGSDRMMDNPDLQERLNDFWEDMENHPRLLDAYEEWAECLGDDLDGIEIGGDPIDRPWDMYSYLDKLKYEAMGLEIVPYTDPYAGEMGGPGRSEVAVVDTVPGEDFEQEYYTAWFGEDGVGEAAVGEPQPIADDELEELRALELDLWAKDWACQQEAKIQETRLGLEQDLADELRAEFPELGSDDS